MFPSKPDQAKKGVHQRKTHRFAGKAQTHRGPFNSPLRAAPNGGVWKPLGKLAILRDGGELVGGGGGGVV